MVTTESLVDSVVFRWLPFEFAIQASPSRGNHLRAYGQLEIPGLIPIRHALEQSRINKTAAASDSFAWGLHIVSGGIDVPVEAIQIQ